MLVQLLQMHRCIQFGVLLLLTATCVAGVMLYHHGEDADDQMLALGDDEFIDVILAMPFPFYGSVDSTVHVRIN